MDFEPTELDTLSREDLILRARARGVERPEQMTRVELRDEIVRRSEPDPERQRRSRGWLGVARDLLASVVESGLNLPDAAAAIRGDGKDHEFQGPPPVATVTLAEIYATQGHYEQALRMLDEVIEREPEHESARALRDRIAEERDLGPGRRRKVVETKAETVVTPGPPPAAVAASPEPAPAEATPVPAVASPLVVVPEAAPSALPSQRGPASVVVVRTGSRAFVYWRLPALSPSLRLRTVTVSPSAQGMAVEEADHALPISTGGFWLSRMAPGAEVRVAVGDLSDQGFAPLTVARVVAGRASTEFEPPGVQIDPEFEAAARSAAGL